MCKNQPQKNPPESGGFDCGSTARAAPNYFCHVRFLWRLDFKRFRRLCLFIFRRRFFLRFPMGVAMTVWRHARLSSQNLDGPQVAGSISASCATTVEYKESRTSQPGKSAAALRP